MSKNLFVLGVIAVALGVTSAATEDEINAVRTALRPHLAECGEELGVTKEQLLAAKESGNTDSIDSCFHACFFKKIGFIDANGHFDANVALEKNKKYFTNEDDIAKIEQIGQTCSSVNDQTVSDGDKACERSKLLFDCLYKEKSNILPFETS